MPPDMTMDMRRSKLKAEEAALLAGELKKPSWQSRNEGIHERVSFEDSIWGFDLAGGAFYKTPLRVVGVKPDSRAQKAGIRVGDRLNRINDIDTSTLTIQEAHEIIIESGVHLRLSVTAPEDEEDSYFCYEDPLENIYELEEQRRIEEEKARKRQVHAKVSSYWSLQWPWVSKRRIIYRESNCFMVPSKYEGKHKDKFTELKSTRQEEDLVLESTKCQKDRIKSTKTNDNIKQNDQTMVDNFKSSQHITNGTDNSTLLNLNHNDVREMNGNLGNIQEIEEEIVDGVEDNSAVAASSQDEVNNNKNNDQEDLLDESDNTAMEVNDDYEINTNEKMAVDNEDEFIGLLDENEINSKIDDDEVLNSILSDSDEPVVANCDNTIDER